MTPDVKAFFDDATNTVSYVVREPQGRACAIIDSVLDFDHASGRTDTASADAIIAHVRAEKLKVEWILETHVHADHLSAAPYLQQQLGGKIGIGDQITVVQDTFGKVFNEGTEFQRDGSQFDALFTEGDSFHIGQLRGDVLHTPGHTPACLTYVIGDAAFVGDTLFMPDYGTARCDFPGGSSRTLFKSIQKILSLPDADPHLRRPRLQGAGPRRLCLGNHRGRAEGAERACRQGPQHRGVRQDARRARRDPGHAAADPALAAGQHARRADAAARREGRRVPEATGQQALTRTRQRQQGISQWTSTGSGASSEAC